MRQLARRPESSAMRLTDVSTNTAGIVFGDAVETLLRICVSHLRKRVFRPRSSGCRVDEITLRGDRDDGYDRNRLPNVPPGVATPDRLESRLGTLNFTDGVPDAATAQKLFDELDYVHAVTAFINGYAAVNQLALLKGFRAAGVNDNEVLVTSGLMDAKCLFLTANADTYYMWAYLDLSKGPLVVETAGHPRHHRRHVVELGLGLRLPGADRGLGGKYLLLPPGYSGDVPEGGFYVRKSRTNHVAFLGRAFLQKTIPSR